MDLEFKLQEGLYVAEFTADTKFNLHIERASGGLVKIQQRGSYRGEYADIESISKANLPMIIDYDVPVDIAPKYFKIILETAPTLAIVSFA